MKAWLFILFSTFLLSCDKDCTYKNLPKKDCQKNYHSVDGDYIQSYSVSYYGFSTPYIVNSDTEYVAHFTDNMSGNQILGDIDFTQKSIIGYNIKTDPCSDYKSQGYLCKNNNSEKWKFHVDYSLKDQCDGSGITTYKFGCFFICDKIPDGSLIDARVINVNPFE